MGSGCRRVTWSGEAFVGAAGVVIAPKEEDPSGAHWLTSNAADAITPARVGKNGVLMDSARLR